MPFRIHALLVAEIVALLYAVGRTVRRAGAAQAAYCQTGTCAYRSTMIAVDGGPGDRAQ